MKRGRNPVFGYKPKAAPTINPGGFFRRLACSRMGVDYFICRNLRGLPGGNFMLSSRPRFLGAAFYFARRAGAEQ
jgi:hypothetical protein